MTERTAELRALAEDLRDREAVADAWTAKSFTDRLFVVEVAADASLPGAVRERLHECDLREANEEYGIDGAADADFAGDLGDARRYRFVDVRTRGEHQSYVID